MRLNRDTVAKYKEVITDLKQKSFGEIIEVEAWLQEAAWMDTAVV